MSISFQAEKRPVILERIIEKKVVLEVIEETCEKLSNKKPELTKLIVGSSQLFHFEIDPISVTDDCWEMLDNLEAYLAKNLDGVIYSDEGIYDNNLTPVLLF